MSKKVKWGQRSRRWNFSLVTDWFCPILLEQHGGESHWPMNSLHARPHCVSLGRSLEQKQLEWLGHHRRRGWDAEKEEMIQRQHGGYFVSQVRSGINASVEKTQNSLKKRKKSHQQLIKVHSTERQTHYLSDWNSCPGLTVCSWRLWNCMKQINAPKNLSATPPGRGIHHRECVEVLMLDSKRSPGWIHETQTYAYRCFVTYTLCGRVIGLLSWNGEMISCSTHSLVSISNDRSTRAWQRRHSVQPIRIHNKHRQNKHRRCIIVTCSWTGVTANVDFAKIV